jgi:hypothetical protein
MRTRIACVVFILAACAALVAACGSPPPVKNAGTAQMQLYNNADFGFSVGYPVGWLQAKPQTGDPTKGAAAFTILWADPEGGGTGKTTVDGTAVSVYQLNQAIRPEQVKQSAANFRAIIGALVAKYKGLKVVQPVRYTEVGGAPAYTVMYVYKAGGTDVAAMSEALPKGKNVYWMTGQASKATWDKVRPQLVASLSSLRLQ